MAKTVMEKNQEILIQKNEGARLAQVVNQIHKLLASAGLGGSEQIAQQAANFLTWLLFGNYNNNFLTIEYRKELLKDTDILGIVNKFNNYADKSIELSKMGEQYRITGEQDLAKQMGQFSQERGIFTEEGLVNIINKYIVEEELKIKQSGTDQMTVWLSPAIKSILNNSIKEIDKNLNNLMNSSQLVKSGRRLRYAYKDVKLDTMADNPSVQINFAVEDPNLQAELQAVYSVLASASIKSKNKLNSIDLEDVTISKAYSAFINYSRKKKISQTEIKNLFIKYYQTEEMKDDPYITAHLNHLISVYALTGLGTTLQSDLRSILDGAKYLVVVDNINKKVIIHSTNKIINEILLKNTYSKGIVNKINLNLTRI